MLPTVGCTGRRRAGRTQGTAQAVSRPPVHHLHSPCRWGTRALPLLLPTDSFQCCLKHTLSRNLNQQPVQASTAPGLPRWAHGQPSFVGGLGLVWWSALTTSSLPQKEKPARPSGGRAAMVGSWCQSRKGGRERLKVSHRPGAVLFQRNPAPLGSRAVSEMFYIKGGESLGGEVTKTDRYNTPSLNLGLAARFNPLCLFTKQKGAWVYDPI